MGDSMSKVPPVDFTLTVRQPDEHGIWSIVGSVPGLFLAGKNLSVLLADVPFAVTKLREYNGDERRSYR
jgi:hypothetical protein